MQPIEVVAKVPIIQKDTKMNSIAFKNLIMESHLMKLIFNQDYIAEIKEEIIEFNE
jgi:hypothetical protein